MPAAYFSLGPIEFRPELWIESRSTKLQSNFLSETIMPRYCRNSCREIGSHPLVMRKLILIAYLEGTYVFNSQDYRCAFHCGARSCRNSRAYLAPARSRRRAAASEHFDHASFRS